MTRRSKTTRKSGSESATRGRLVLPVFLVGLFIACAGVAIKHMSVRTADVDQVRREIVDVVTRRGYVGPFFMHTGSLDELTGDFIDFHAETDRILIAARRARVEINAATDTISFLLVDATIVQVPGGGGESIVAHRATYLLGPFPYSGNIVDNRTPGIEQPMTPDVR